MGCCGSKEDEEEREPLTSGKVYEAPNSQRQQIAINSDPAVPVYTSSSLVLSASLGRSWEDPSNPSFQDVIQKTVSSLIDVAQNNSVGGVSSKEAERRIAKYKESSFKVTVDIKAFELPRSSHEHVDLHANHIDRGLLEIVTKDSETITQQFKSMHVKDTGPFVVNFSSDEI